MMRYLDTTTTDKPVSRVGLGTWQFGSREWEYGDRYSDQDAGLIVDRAAELGITLFNTKVAAGNKNTIRIKT